MLPNFLVIGSSRSGTTSLYHHLGQHPQAYVTPVIEPRFFAFEDSALDFSGPGDQLLRHRVVTRWDDYVDLFTAARGQRAVGEVSPAYLCSAETARRIHRRVPAARILAILRNPVERAISSFCLERLDGFEPEHSLRAAIGKEEARREANWSYVWRYHHRGRYHQHLRRYFDLFPKEQIGVWLYEDWEPDGGQTLLNAVFAFLGLDPDLGATDEVVRLNTTGADRFRTCRLERSEPSEEDLAWLTELYRDDIARLEELLCRDLSHWRRFGGS
ncbi:MAG: hypothetical protein GEU83_19445 [Pseudonocardiaceae bacterium]|nr:hypothetical protein [Pseudonocardiaceae bacterium]